MSHWHGLCFILWQHRRERSCCEKRSTAVPHARIVRHEERSKNALVHLGIVRGKSSDPSPAAENILQSRRVLAVLGSCALAGLRVRYLQPQISLHSKLELQQTSQELCFFPSSPLACSYGYRTWEWAAGLRGYLHPSIFALLYKVYM